MLFKLLSKIFFYMLLISLTHAEVANYGCENKPIPKITCRIGNCVNGKWEEICEPPPDPTCGMMPTPRFNCRIGRCIEGKWEEICNISPDITCDISPIPKPGCRIGKCINRVWEEICD